jgi:hypothetical protein
MAPHFTQDYRQEAQAAIRAFDRAIACAPGTHRHPETLSALALRGLARRLLNREDALTDFRLVLQQNPLHRAALTHGIMQLLQAQDFTLDSIPHRRAQLWCGLALQAYPHDPYARLAEALIADRLGDNGLCIAQLQRLIDAHPGYLAGHLALAAAHLALYRSTHEAECAEATLDACRHALALGQHVHMAWSIIEQLVGYHINIDGSLPLYARLRATYGGTLKRPADCLKLPLCVQDPALLDEVGEFWRTHTEREPLPSTAAQAPSSAAPSAPVRGHVAVGGHPATVRNFSRPQTAPVPMPAQPPRPMQARRPQQATGAAPRMPTEAEDR